MPEDGALLSVAQGRGARVDASPTTLPCAIVRPPGDTRAATDEPTAEHDAPIRGKR